MKIYQIHETCGEYEDKYDVIVGSYLLQDKAEDIKNNLKLEQELEAKCKFCPLYFCEEGCDNNCEECVKHSLERVKSYCDKFEPFNEESIAENEFYRNKCINFTYCYEVSRFYIEEVEVIE